MKPDKQVEPKKATLKVWVQAFVGLLLLYFLMVYVVL